jgi:hypothetical protein
MKQLAITALLILTGLGAQAQTTETRNVSNDFTAIEVKNGIQVIFTQSDAPSVKVESDNQEYAGNIITEVKNGTLKIYMKEYEEDSRSKPAYNVAKVYVSKNTISGFKLTTGAAVKVMGRLVVNELALKLATGSNFTGELECATRCIVKAESGAAFRGKLTTDMFEGTTSGGASIKIIGSAKTSTVYCNGGSLMAGKFICEKANITASNAASAYVNAVQSIKAEADSSSSVTYYGEPANVNLSENTYSIKRDNYKFALN